MKIINKLKEAVARFTDVRILVIGDIIIDHFIWGVVSRISPEAPVPVVNVRKEELILGGSANVLRNIFSLGGSGAICGIIGSDPMGDRVVELIKELSASTEGLIVGKRPTTVKTRIVAQGQQVVRFDREEIGIPSKKPLGRMLHYLEQHLSEFDAVIVSDYAKGVINEEFMRCLHHKRQEIFKKEGKRLPLIVDPKPANLHHFVGATVITPNHHEAKQMSGMEILNDKQSILAAARHIRDDIDCEGVLITRGEAGMALLDENDTLVTIPAVAKEVYDVTGAGDTVAGTLAMGLAVGCSLKEAAVLANYAAGIVVGKVGTAAVTAKELSAQLV
jgi:D-beta-D-heptose 7-phosphate kinase/D-beta-D-heptose 1-phosphate adenosyltransferase